MTERARQSRWTWAAVAVGAIAVERLALLAVGRVPICTCGSVKLRHGVALGLENSRHVVDRYSLNVLMPLYPMDAVRRRQATGIR